MLSILAIGDPHFKTDNIVAVDIFINNIEKLALTQKPDIIVCLGDLLHDHERLHTIPLNKAYEFIDRMRKISPTYVIVGNHDFIGNQQFLSENHWMNGLKEWENTFVVDKVMTHIENGVKLVLCPYVPPSRFEEALSTLPTGYKDANLILCHQEFFGCKMGAIVSVDGDKWSEDYPFIISGHIHNRQKPQKNIYYPGASIQTAFGETEDTIVANVIVGSDNEVDIKEIDLGLPKKKIIRVNIDDVDDFVLPKNVNNDDIKVTITGDQSDFNAFKKSEKYKQLTKKAKVVFKKDASVKENISAEDNANGDANGDNDFKIILRNLIEKEGESKSLIELYELLINGREILVL